MIPTELLATRVRKKAKDLMLIHCIVPAAAGVSSVKRKRKLNFKNQTRLELEIIRFGLDSLMSMVQWRMVACEGGKKSCLSRILA